MSADDDLLRFVLRHGDRVVSALWMRAEYVDGAEADQLRAAARDLEWLVKVNRPDWSHDEHTADCQSDWTVEACKSITMTPETLKANHDGHMKVVRRIEAAWRAER